MEENFDLFIKWVQTMDEKVLNQLIANLKDVVKESIKFIEGMELFNLLLVNVGAKAFVYEQTDDFEENDAEFIEILEKEKSLAEYMDENYIDAKTPINDLRVKLSDKNRSVYIYNNDSKNPRVETW